MKDFAEKLNRYTLNKVEKICDLYIAGETLTPELLQKKEIYRRKKTSSYLFVIVRAIVDGL